MLKRQSIEVSSNNSKKTRLNSEEECEKDQKNREKDRCKSVQSLTLKLEDLPDEMILKVLSYLDTANLIHSGHVSQRLRAISSDESLWRKMNLFKKRVPSSFLQFVLERGCKYLSLHLTCLHGSLNLTKPTKLKYLNVNSCTTSAEDASLEKLFAACHSLEKLTFSEDKCANIMSTSSMISNTCRKNKQTLKVLYLNVFPNCVNPYYEYLIRHIVLNCSELKEVSIIGKRVHEGTINYLVKNISPNVEKLRLDMQNITDKQVKAIIKRCNKLTELILRSQTITNETVTNIIEHLPTLKKLNLMNSEIDCATFLKFKRMPNLRVLNWDQELISLLKDGFQLSDTHTNYLKTQGLIINQDIFNVAAPQTLMNLRYWRNWKQLEKDCKNEIWEIKVKQLSMLPYIRGRI